MIKEKNGKISSSKESKISGLALLEFLGLLTLGSIISGISPSVLKILVLILLLIS